MRMSLCMAVVALTLLSACKTKEKAQIVTKPTAEKPEVHVAVAKVKTPPSSDRHSALAAVFGDSRCVMMGVLSATPSMYTRHGFSDDAAFRTAFALAAESDPLWARGVVEKAYATSCTGTKTDPAQKAGQ